MQKAKQAVQDFISQDGKHTTTVHEDTRKAVTEEHVQPQKHENVTTAVDKEVHQDHHHTTVQPIKHKEVLPEKHTHNVAPVEHKTFDHGNKDHTHAHLERDAAKYKDTSVTHDTKHTTSTAPVVGGEHTHHHVHEHIQPVIQKETVAPHVVHTTVPIHETHHAEAVHHGTSVLPTKTLEEFKNERPLEGHSLRKVGEYEGCPSHYEEGHQHETLEGDRNMHAHTKNLGGRTGGLGSTEGHHTEGHHTEGHHTEGHHQNRQLAEGAAATGNTGLAGNKAHTRSEGLGRTDQTQAASTGAQTTKKPSLGDRLNPFKDADGDGKKGLMD